MTDAHSEFRRSDSTPPKRVGSKDGNTHITPQLGLGALRRRSLEQIKRFGKEPPTEQQITDAWADAAVERYERCYD